MATRSKFLAQAALVAGLASSATDLQGAETEHDADYYRAELDRYCVTCHNRVLKTAGMTLDQVDVADPGRSRDVWERVITKLSLNAMPPVGMPHPDDAFYSGFLDYLQSDLDEAANVSPDPGRTAVHRLNRTEYANAILDLLAIEVDAEELLPPDNIGAGFDNIAEVLAVSPLLMERYLFAANRIGNLAIGPSYMQPAGKTYAISDSFRQLDRTNEELPFGSRGGAVFQHRFPMDGEYTIDVRLHKNIEGYIRGVREKAIIDVRLDHEQVGTLEFGGAVFGPSGPTWTESQVIQYAGHPDQVGYEFTGDNNLQLRFDVRAGTHSVGVSFAVTNVKKTGFKTPELTLPGIMSYKGGLATLESVTITGPFNPRGPGDTESRRRIFTCYPDVAADFAAQERCAESILGNLARKAYRRPVTETDIRSLLDLFRQGRDGQDFESGIGLALQGILAGPEFLFRIESDPPAVSPGEIYRIDDIELASRLSFFLWSSIPDEELLAVAAAGQLRDPDRLRRQVQRMIADPRFNRFVNNFGRQWLAVREVDIAEPNLEIFPEYDAELREAFKQEVLLWFASLIRNDRSVLELLTSAYTYANERLARHYGLQDVRGSRLRPVDLADVPERHGLLGKGGFLIATAYNNRTSPVIRGKWVLENLLNMPPPPPPEDVPALEVSEDGKALTLKQAMERHRANPVCASCHKLMDPIGFALENYDAIGAYRARYVEADAAVDASGLLFDGSNFETGAEFRSEFLKHDERIVHTATEKMLTYALGRGLEYYDQPAVRKIVRDSAAQNFAWSSIIIGVINSTPFQYRRTSAYDGI